MIEAYSIMHLTNGHLANTRRDNASKQFQKFDASYSMNRLL